MLPGIVRNVSGKEIGVESLQRLLRAHSRTSDQEPQMSQKSPFRTPLATEFASATFCGDSWRAAAQRQNQTFVRSAAKCSSALTTMRTLRTVACSCLTTDIGLRRITGMWPGSDCRGTRRVISCAASWRLMCETLAHNGTRLSWAAVRSNAAWRSAPSCSRSRS